MRHETELLAPAGSAEGLHAAVNAGADAVYIGGRRFGARAYADNPDEKELIEGIRFAHLHGCDVYLTINTLLKDEELEELGGYLRPYYESGLDAVIVQDVGVLSYVREFFPDLDIHASTQMNVTGVYGAAFLKKQGVKRVVTARELSLEEIGRIHDKVDIEIESFIHGALCYCYSGRCLFSSMLGGRSGNRGRCAQPCRLPYRLKENGRLMSRPKEPYLLSPKDICTVEILPEILKAGVCSLKIEGRMKRPEYTAGVVSIYRKYLDRYLLCGADGYSVEKEDYDALLTLYNRGGFSRGYYEKHNGRDLISLKTPKHFDDGERNTAKKREYDDFLKNLHREYLEHDKKEAVRGRFRIEVGSPALLEVECRGVKAIVKGAPGAAALKQPLSAEDIDRQLRKTGNTPFEFEKIETEAGPDVFCPAGQINRMRREALLELEQKLIGEGARPAGDPFDTSGGHEAKTGTEETVKPKFCGGRPHLSVCLERVEYLDSVLCYPQVDAVCLNSERLDFEKLPEYAARCRRAKKRCLLVMPSVFRVEAERCFDENEDLIRHSGIDGFAVMNPDGLGYLLERGFGLPIVGDQSLYAWNKRARDFWRECGIVMDTVPAELNAGELKIRGCAGSVMPVYGYLPLMTTAGCLKKTVKGCDGKESLLYLEDRYNVHFPCVNYCRFCCNVIYNSVPLSLLGQRRELEKLNPSGIQLVFTIEDGEEISRVTADFIEEYFPKGKPRAKSGASLSDGRLCAYTRGHFKRGVQ